MNKIDEAIAQRKKAKDNITEFADSLSNYANEIADRNDSIPKEVDVPPNPYPEAAHLAAQEAKAAIAQGDVNTYNAAIDRLHNACTQNCLHELLFTEGAIKHWKLAAASIGDDKALYLCDKATTQIELARKDLRKCAKTKKMYKKNIHDKLEEITDEVQKYMDAQMQKAKELQ